MERPKAQLGRAVEEEVLLFGRNSNPNDRSEDQRSVRPITQPSGTRQAIAVPITPPAPAAPAANESLLAAEDRFEGKLTTTRGIRILGTAEGSIESESHVHIDENARVTADVTADEVVIAGQYSGNLVCRQRLEILPTGRVSGSIETVKLMLHEGGYVDGELHMQKPGDKGAASKSDDGRSSSEEQSETPGRFGSTPRTVGSIRSTVEPSVRQPAATSGGSNTAE